MKQLDFARESTPLGRRRVRRAVFAERSLLPAAAACMVAGGVRETLGAVLATPLRVRLFEPAIPTAQAWECILGGALLYRYRGPAGDAAFVLRGADAAAIAAALFGEPSPEASRTLSPLERDVLDRAVAACSGALSAVCGAGLERTEASAGFTTYFEVLVERPFEAAIGVALAGEPRSEGRPALALEDLAAMPLATRVELDAGRLTAAEVAALAPGAMLPLVESRTLRGRLSVGGRTLSTGTCGIRNGCFAFEIEGAREERGATV
ncbi:MAG TPA: FliM/FliN family flagellar motor switch protein [Verrucomicrobiae bacterium]|nr:FliM/FliN family flagellar motor switch protein [Verrucomicrobiae bacterium]